MDWLKTTSSGLTKKEAESRILKYGYNVFGKKNINALIIFGRQFRSSLIYLLIIADIISFWIKDYSDGVIVLVILLINTLFGFFQEYKSEKIIEKLSHFIAKQVRVKRSGQSLLIDASQLVPGDIVIIRQGDIVPADLRLIESDNLQINESSLTGESTPVTKQLLTEQDNFTNLLFAGSTVEGGAGTGIIYATGRNSEFGNIAELATGTKKETQYEKSLQSLSSSLVKITLFGLGLVFIIKLILNAGF